MIMFWWGFSWIVAGILASLVTVLLAVAAPRLLRGHPTSLASLHTSMFLTAASIVLVGAGLLWLVMTLLGYEASVFALTVAIAGFGLLQWLISPWIINIFYRVREAGAELEWLRVELERLARAAGMKPPRLVVARMDAPNAFAYGNPLTGYYVAVTEGLLRLLPRDEILAVVGHELGHIRHKDVQVVLALSLLPSVAYFIGRLLVELGFWGGGGRNERSNPLVFIAVGAAIIAVSFILHFLVRHFNRLREYYADAHSVLLTGSARSLQRALARIYAAYTRNERYIAELHSHSAASMLFIINMLIEFNGGMLVNIDSLVERLKRMEPNPLEELFSTHPPRPNMLRFLD